MNRVWFVITHLVCFAIGVFVFVKMEEPQPPSKEVSSKRLVRAPLPKDVNPLSVATSADYQRAFEDYFGNGGHTINAQRLFQQWALVDPDAAILAISEIYHVHRASNMLSNLIQEMETELAPSLVKHYGEFEYISHFDLHSITGRTLAKLAEENLDQALDLLRKLPVSRDNLPLDDIMSGMDGPQLDAFLDRITGSDADLIAGVDSRFWEDMTDQAWRVLSPEKYESLFQRFDQPEVVKSLTRGALKEVDRFGRPERFVRIFESLSRDKQDGALFVFTDYLKRASAESLSGLQEASEEQGSTLLLDAIKSHSGQ